MPPTSQPGDPYCGKCGFDLRGAVSTPACPECGGALVEVLRRRGGGRLSRKPTVRRRSAATFLGYPVVCIAMGPDPESGERFGRAKGLLAIGDVATGGIAIGGVAVGVVSLGGVSVGLGGIGGLSVGLVVAFGGCAVGGFAVGGAAIGGVATGGGAVGYIAQGGGAYGYYARGAKAGGTHVISGRVNDPAAVQMFTSIEAYVGSGANAKAWLGTSALTGGLLLGALAAVMGLIVLGALRGGRSRQSEDELRFGRPTSRAR